MVAVFAALIGWQMWELHRYNAAVLEAKEAGFGWECDDTLSLIRQDWRNAFKKETWTTHERSLSVMVHGNYMEFASKFARSRDLIHRLQPTKLVMPNFGNVDVLRGLNSIKNLTIADGFNNRAPLNLDGLKDLTALQSLEMEETWAILGPRNLDALYGLKNLRFLRTKGCNGISAKSVRELQTALPNLVFKRE